MNIRWGNRLEMLADDLLGRLGQNKVGMEEIFAKRDGIVVTNRIQQAWLQQRFLYDAPRATVPHVLANCDFPLLNLFVADWLHRMGNPEGGNARLDPETHPFSVKSMRWRIFDFLTSSPLDNEFAPLRRYVVDPNGSKPHPRKCFKLAGRLAALMDQYATYRPQMVIDWEKGRNTGTSANTIWEPALWRILMDHKKNGEKTYLDAFVDMKKQLGNCRIEQTYRRIFVFAPSMLPGVQLAFFRALGSILPVDFYLFNPSPSTDWFDRESERARLSNHGDLERADDEDGLFEKQHPLLSAYARGSRDLVAGAIDLTGGQVEDLFPELAEPRTVLEQLQQSIVRCDGSMDPSSALNEAIAPSIQLHLCHGKMREVEILRDHILKCFEEMPDLQPRHVQVQVVDINAYAPYIEAVFATLNPNGRDAIPIAMADRMAAGESPAAEAFRQLLELPDSRFTAPEVMDLLRCESVAKMFAFEPEDVDQLADWLDQAGVRWGQDQEHRARASKANFAEQTSWKHGIDRLLLGYALGQGFEGKAMNGHIPRDCAEGDGAVRLGRLAHFYEELKDFSDYGQTQHPVAEWADRLEKLVDDFFVSDNETFWEVAMLKSAIRLLRTTIHSAGFNGEVPLAVVRDFLSGHLGETEGGADLNRNAVVFSSLRPGSSAPRRVQCLLGMGDGLFPRTASRPSYDLLREGRKMGDRSPAIEDRMAFLEVVMNARERLLIFYPAFSEEDNTESCESVVVKELVEYLLGRFGKNSFQVTRHRLQAFHPAYFGGDAKRPDLFSYSASNWAAARNWRNRKGPEADSGDGPAAPATESASAVPEGQVPLPIEPEDVISFFKNPARHHYRKIFGVDLEPKGEVALADAETFKLGPLEEFQVRQQMVAALATPAKHPTPDSLRDAFIADGTIPLAASGARWFDAAQANVVALLDSSWDQIGTLRAALEDHAQAVPVELAVNVMVAGCQVQLRGTVPVTPQNRIFLFRCSTPKAEVRLEAWITHLFARAAGQTVLSVVAQGKNAEKLDEEDQVAVYCFADPKTAEGSTTDPLELLTAYLRIYLEGLRQIPPYTPATALEFVETQRRKDAENEKRKVLETQPPPAPAKAGKSKPPKPVLTPQQIDDAAIEAARKKWTSGFKRPAYDGDRDPYFRTVHGEDGPFQDSNKARFISLAKQIMKPMLQSQERLTTGGN